MEDHISYNDTYFFLVSGSSNCTRYDVIDGIFYCFELNSNEATFEESETNCRSKGGSLPVITSSEVNDILLPIAKEPVDLVGPGPAYYTLEMGRK